MDANIQTKSSENLVEDEQQTDGSSSSNNDKGNFPDIYFEENQTLGEAAIGEESFCDWEDLTLDDNLEITFKKHGLSKRNVKTIIRGILKDESVQKILKPAEEIQLRDLICTRSRNKIGKYQLAFPTLI